MEAANNSSQRPAPRQPQPGMARGVRPVGRRPMVDGFAPKRPNLSPVRPQRQDVAPHAADIVSSPHPRPAAPSVKSSGQTIAPSSLARSATPHVASKPTATPMQHRPTLTQLRHAEFIPNREVPEPELQSTELEPANTAHAPKEKDPTGHAGLVGFATFVVLSVLLLAPILPGKIFQNFPLTSSTFSTGDQTLDCLGTQGTVTSTTSYTTKIGSPITYKFSTSTSQHATCDGQTQNAVTGHTSQFSPLGLLVDFLTAVAVAVVVGQVWRLLFGKKHQKSHR